jgi:serine/threonine-protein kinase RsbW
MSDKISLVIPAKPDYFLTARLTASSVASRMGFDVNDVEDIKTAVAESLLMIVNQEKSSEIKIEILNESKAISIEVAGVEGSAPKVEIKPEDTSLSKYLIEALADESYFQQEGDAYLSIRFIKNMQG